MFCSVDYTTNESATQCKLFIQTCKAETNKKIIINDVKSVDATINFAFCGYDDLKNNDAAMKDFTGVSLIFFKILLKFVRPKAIGQPDYYKTLSAENRLLLFLTKMKTGDHFSFLARLFKISHSTASKIFHDTLETIYESVKTWIFWPSKEAIKKTMPKSFKNYPNTRAIIDCTEIFCDKSSSVEKQILMYSSYKVHHTVKYLIAISPSGLITFLSKGFSGKSTDSFITNQSGFLDLIEPGDFILADKGFPRIKSELQQRKCTLVMPPFAFNPQFEREEVLEGYAIASVRIHVERAIQRIKLCEILNKIDSETVKHIDKIMHVACVFANIRKPLIAKK